MILGVFWEGVPLRDHFLRSEVAGGRPRRPRGDFVSIFSGFGPPFGDPRGALWGAFGRQSLQMERLCCSLWCFFRGSIFGAFFRVVKTRILIPLCSRLLGFAGAPAPKKGSILEYFWEPSSPLYSSLGGLGMNFNSYFYGGGDLF